MYNIGDGLRLERYIGRAGDVNNTYTVTDCVYTQRWTGSCAAVSLCRPIGLATVNNTVNKRDRHREETNETRGRRRHGSGRRGRGAVRHRQPCSAPPHRPATLAHSRQSKYSTDDVIGRRVISPKTFCSTSIVSQLINIMAVLHGIQA